MTWEDAGVDAVIGAGGGVWHLRLPASRSGKKPGGNSPRAEFEQMKEAVVPTMARIWPGGQILTEKDDNIDDGGDGTGEG